jgi:hypothetical protein
MKSALWPKTTLGKWSVGLGVAGFLLFVVFFIEVALGFRGGDTLDFSDFSQILPGIPIMLAGVSFISAMVTGIIGIVKYKERNILVFLAAAAGLFVLLLVGGEFLFPH